MSDVIKMVNDHFDLWSTAIKRRSAAGRGSSNKIELYGIKKLRELILELAVRGLLVPQNPNDEPASALLKKIATEKAKLVKEGKIKKEGALVPISEQEKPFDLPMGWEWAALPQICYYGPGKTPSTKNSEYWEESGTGFPWISISDMEHLKTITQTTKRITSKAAADVFRCEPVSAGTMIMSFKLTLGKISKLGVDAYHNEAIIALHPYTGICKDFVFNFLPGRALKGNSKSAIKGNTLNSESLARLLIPIPPAKEQDRIVAKVDALMALCDQLELQTEASLEAHQILVQTLLNALTSATDRKQFVRAWQRVSEHFDTVFTSEESIEQLKQTILQLAVMGKLVPQDPNDEPASELLKKIAVEKIRLSNSKPLKSFSEVTTGLSLHKIPNTWVWCSFQEIFLNLKYGTSKKCDYNGGAIPVLRIPNISNGEITLEDLKSTDLNAKEVSDLSLQKNDILMIRSNGSESLVGKSAVVDDKAIGFSYAGYLIRIRLPTNLVNADYLHYVLQCPMTRSLIEGPIRTTSGVKNINSTEVSKLRIPLPPLPEQHRIALKINQLMKLCDALGQSIVEANCQKIEFLDALMTGI